MLSVALTELGAGLVASPLLAGTLAAGALLRLGDQAAEGRLLPGIASGELIATLAAGGTGDGTRRRRHADRRDRAGAQRGAGRRAAGPRRHRRRARSCSRSTPGTPGLEVTPLPALDHSRSLARVRLDGAAGTPAGRRRGRGARLRRGPGEPGARVGAARRHGRLPGDDHRVRQDPGRLRPGRSARSRGSSTGWPSCAPPGSWRTPRCGTPPAPPTSGQRISRAPRRSPGSRCRPATSTPRSRPCSCTAASASPGSTTRTCTRRTPCRSMRCSAGPDEQLDRLAALLAAAAEA